MGNESKPMGGQQPGSGEQKRPHSDIPENRPGNKEPAEGSRDSAGGGGGAHRPASDDKQRPQNVPPRGDSKERGQS